MKLPIHLLLLDFLGCVLIGGAMAMHLGDVPLLPEQYRFDNDTIIYLLLGVACMMPAVIFILNGIRNRHKS
ncbi:DUF1418 family protein [Gilvimarinus sp. SDUM040013]|uniref:DUF1418 family protein n=1 Tax=Gilvimarinus gilvus TaxID=3058038 RepID=A0ABU4RTM1_9GAMM|nr:DUF1418 family protein [Gilvimarinus sp. SDUM040013]MDO3386834.1 DUF1418 family protein [Gilvimarinus sp. SDUM040013]MDX6848236.1 DUF1418 family protein [Gilvimarinus sp. SDUM040013]